MKKGKLEFSTRLTREDVAGIVEALMEGLKDGVLKVQKSGETLELAVPRVVDLEIEAEIDDERAEFELEISWRTHRAEPDSVPEENEQATSAQAPEKAPKRRSSRAKAVKEAEESLKDAAKATKNAARSIAKAAGKSGKAAGKTLESAARTVKKTAHRAKAAEALTAAAEVAEETAEKTAEKVRRTAKKAGSSIKNLKKDAKRIAAEQAERLAAKARGGEGKVIDVSAESPDAAKAPDTEKASK